MEFDIAVGLIGSVSGLIGAVVGGGVTLLANLQANRSANDQREQERKQAVADRQFEAHISFLNRANDVQEHMRQHWDNMSEDIGSERLAESKLKYIEGWRTYFISTSAARLAGPQQLETKAEALRESLLALSVHLDTWIREYDKTREAGAEPAKTKELWESELEKLVNAVTKAKTSYVQEGQKLLSS